MLLSGRTVLLTRAREGASAFAAALRERGAQVRFLPLLEILPIADPTALDSALRSLADCDLAVFTSANGVTHTLARWRLIGSPGAWPPVACVGSGTAAVAEQAGLRVELVPGLQHAEGLLEALIARGVTGRRVLLAQADNARPLLAEGLRRAGASLLAVAAYRSVDRAADPDLLGIDAICFASSETVRRFARLGGLPVRWPTTVAIGPQTAATLTAMDQGPAAVAIRPDAAGLADAVCRALAGPGPESSRHRRSLVRPPRSRPMIPAGLDRPLRFTPVYQSVVWGGRRLATWRADLPPGPVGESWELSQQARGVSLVAEGPLAGRSLADLMATDGAALVGAAADGSGEFPLLIKIIDASDRLSIQVHPDDELAQRFGVGRRGKTECWYLIGDGGELFQGTRPGTDREAFARALQTGTVEELVNRFETRDGDFFAMPARTVHALGRGCLLFEIQQSCDCTFRVYDWGRVGLDGQPRELHIEQSLATIDFSDGDWGPVAAPSRSDPRGGSRRDLVDCRYFRVEERRGATTMLGGDEACSVVMLIDGEGELATAAGGLALRAMQTALVPACAGDWTFVPVAGDCRLLVATPR